MRIYKRLTALALCLLCLTALLPLSAAAEAFDVKEPLSLTVSYLDDRQPVVGAPFRLYKVAKLNEDLSLTTDPTFTNYRSSIQDPDIRWDVLADALETYVNKRKVTPDDKAVTDDDGNAVFPSGSKALEPGVYLVISERYRYNDTIYYPSPVIITLPNQDVYGAWEYDVTAHAKFTPEEDEPIDIEVIKKWSDKGHEDKRPKSITVILLKDGKEEFRETLNEDNNWSCIWIGLDPIHEWTVKELNLYNYESTISQPVRNGNTWTFTITNRYDPPPPPDLPQTGQLNWPIPVLLASGAVLFCLGCLLRFGRRKDDYAK